MFTIKLPNKCREEREWVLSIIFDDILGLEYKIESHKENTTIICSDNKKIVIQDDFFLKASESWMEEASLPQTPVLSMDTSALPFDINLVARYLPIIYGKPSILCDREYVFIDIDIFGTVFFMLSRYEEVVVNATDKFNRFPASASIAFQEGFLHRPIVNEYIELLWSALKYLWPTLQRKKRTYKMRVSVDVDRPYNCATRDILWQIKQIGKDILVRYNVKLAISNVINYFFSKFGNYSFDPFFNKFDWIMDVNEKANNLVIFYFIAGHTENIIDGCYSMDEPIVRNLIKKISDRGHEIGLHPSFNTYLDLEQLTIEANNLRRVMSEEVIPQPLLSSRQHYLRWDPLLTAKYLEAIGISCDSTLTYADYAGFRCGICYEYKLYDLAERKALNITESPLIVMEDSVFSKECMGYGHSDGAFKTIKNYIDICKQFNGDFTLLWHNSNLLTKSEKCLYEKLVSL